jgi:hypothetical protein
MEMRNERYTELLRDRGVAEYSSEENRCSRQESSGALWPLYCFAQSSASRLPRAVERGLVADPSVFCYSPIVRMTLLSGRVLFDDSLSSCASISSYFGTVVTSPFGTICTTL